MPNGAEMLREAAQMADDGREYYEVENHAKAGLKVIRGENLDEATEED